MSKYGKYTRDESQSIFKHKEDKDISWYQHGHNKLMITCPKCGETAFMRENWSTFTCFKCYNILERRDLARARRRRRRQ